MSDPFVVGLFRQRLLSLSSSPPLPYIDTLNTRPAVLPDIFLALERDFSSVQRVTLGVPSMFREIGSLMVVVSVRSGGGIDLAETLSEEARNLFHNYAVDHFRVLAVDSSTPIAPDEGNFFQMKIPVHYHFDFFK